METPVARIVCGDVFDVLPKLHAGTFDAALLDPIYGYAFMSRDWDTAHRAYPGENEGQKNQAFQRRWLDMAFPLLKPGGPLVAASGSRVYHRLTSAAEDAGFDILPMFVWINGQPMAMGEDISKALDKLAGAEREVVGQIASHRAVHCETSRAGDHHEGDGLITAPSTEAAQLFHGYNTRLKDALCPWLMAYRPPVGGFARNALEFGVAGLNVEASRVPTEDDLTAAKAPRVNSTAYGEASAWRRDGSPAGRFPPNVALDPSAAREMARQSGELKSGAMRDGGRRTAGQAAYGDASMTNRGTSVSPNGDSGGADRFFMQFRYEAKAGGGERLKGCENHFWKVDKADPLGFTRISREEWLGMDHLAGCEKVNLHDVRNTPRSTDGGDDSRTSAAFSGCAPGCQFRQRYAGCIHPTLKPISLITYLARMILPPPHDDGSPRRLLVPFSGVGSEIIGALLAGWDEVVGIEMEPVYCDLAFARIAAWGPYSAGRANRIERAGGLKAEPNDPDRTFLRVRGPLFGT